MALIKPVKQHEALAAEIEAARQSADETKFDLWWLGQSGFLIVWNSHSLLFDPYLSDSLTEKYASTNKPHVRMSELVISPELLTNIDVITSSHNHTDHLDAETLHGLFKASPNAHMLIPEANRDFVATRTGRDKNFPVGLSEGQTKTVGAFTFTGIAAAHNTVDRDEHGNCIFMGFVAKFGPFSVYHSGDTLLHDDLIPSLKPHHVDMAFVPINGNDPARGVAGNLSGAEAAYLSKSIDAQVAIPHHYHMFEFNTAEPEKFVEECFRVKQQQKTMLMGERLTFTGKLN